MLVSGIILITLIIAEWHIMFFTIVLLYTLSGPLLWCLTKLKHQTGDETGGGASVAVRFRLE